MEEWKIGYFVLLVIALIQSLPFFVVFLLKGLDVPAWVILLIVAACAIKVFIGLFADTLRQAYYVYEYSTDADALRLRVQRFAKIRLALWIVYFIALVASVVFVQDLSP